jgi:branched-chain amino acid transport system ATP-binding protein
MIRRIEEAIRTINREGVTILIVEHNVDVIMRLCGHVIVLESGGLLAEGAPELIRRDARVLEAYLGSPRATPAQAPRG